MADNRYGEPRGSGWNDRDRGRTRYEHDSDRSRSGRGGDEDRGFFERAGEEIRSWFGDDDGRDEGRSRDRFERGESRYGRSGGQHSRPQGWGERHPEEDRRYSGSQAGESWRGGSSGGSDFSRNRGEWNESRMGAVGRDRDSFGGGQGRSGSAFGYNDMSGNLGGFGNQTFGSTQDDHYRSWRDRQIEQLDRDYQDYCRERENRFHQDFGSWRQSRQGQQTGASQSSDAAASQPSGSSGSKSFLGSGSDPSAATAGGGGDPTPEPMAGSPTGSRSGRSRSDR